MIRRPALALRRSSLIMLEVAAALVAAAGLGVGMFWWRLSQGPIPLPALKADVEAQLSALRNGRPVSIDTVQLAWNPDARALDLRAVGLRALDGSGEVQSESREVAIGISAQSLFLGRISLVRAAFVGGDVAVTLNADGSAGIAFAKIGAEPDIVIPAPPPGETMQQRVNRVLDGVSATLAPVGAGGGLRQLSIREARLSILDVRTNARFSANDGVVLLAREGDALRLEAQASLAGPRGPAPAALRLDTDTGFSRASISFRAEGVRLAALVSPVMLGQMATLDSPITAAITLGLDRAVGVTDLSGDVTFGRGGIDLAGGRLALDGGRVLGRYNLETDQLEVTELSIAGARTRISGQARLDDASVLFGAAGDRPARFNLNLDSLLVEAPGFLKAPLSFQAVNGTGTLRVDTAQVALERLTARYGDATIAMTGQVDWRAGRDRTLRPSIRAEGTVGGNLPLREALALWPTTIAPRSRGWLEDALLSGEASEGQFRVNLRAEDIANRQIPDQAVSAQFRFRNAAVRYLAAMTPVSEAHGSGSLGGDSMALRVEGARLGELAVSAAQVDMPAFRGPRAAVLVAGTVEGEARVMAETLRPEPVRLFTYLPVDPASISGRGSVRLRVRTPVGLEARASDSTYEIDGRLSDLAATGLPASGGLGIAGANLRVTGDHNSLTASGPLRFGQSALEVEWVQALKGDMATGSRYRFTGVMAQADYERLGYRVAPVVEGPVRVDYRAVGQGLVPVSGSLRLDGEATTIALPSGLWRKPAGSPVRASFALRRSADGVVSLDDIEATGSGLEARGAVRFAPDGRLLWANAPQVQLGPNTQVAVRAERDGRGLMTVTAEGPRFDATPFLATTSPSRPVTAAGSSGQGPVAPAVPPVVYRLATDRLGFRGDAALREATATAVMVGDVMTSLDIEGKSGGTAPFALAMTPDGQMRLSGADAGFAMEAVTGTANLAGGNLSAEGTWRAGRTPEADFTLKVTDFAVEDLPAMARLMSSVASLRGLVEMLEGSGMSFADLEAPLSLRGARLLVGESRLSGASMGLTAKGEIDLATGTMNINGVVVPSYGLNSMWGEVPVLGGLLVSRQGEGVVGMTYSMSGPVENARVGVNPLSALTPGILRRIFEPLRRQPASRPAGATTAIQP